MFLLYLLVKTKVCTIWIILLIIYQITGSAAIKFHVFIVFVSTNKGNIGKGDGIKNQDLSVLWQVKIHKLSAFSVISC